MKLDVFNQSVRKLVWKDFESKVGRTGLLKLFLLFVSNLILSFLDVLAVLASGVLSIAILQSIGNNQLSSSIGFFSKFIDLGNFSFTELGIIILSLLLIKTLLSFILNISIFDFFLAYSKMEAMRHLKILGTESPANLDSVTVDQGNFVFTDGYRIAHISYLHTSILLASELVYMVIMFFTLVFINPFVSIGIFATLLLVIFLQMKFLGYKMQEKSRDFKNGTLYTRRIWSDFKSSHREIWFGNRANYFLNLLGNTLASLRRTNSQINRLQSMPRVISEIYSIISLGMIVLLATLQATAFDAIPIIVMISLAISRMIPSLMKIQGHLIGLDGMEGGLEETLAFDKALTKNRNSHSVHQLADIPSARLNSNAHSKRKNHNQFALEVNIPLHQSEDGKFRLRDVKFEVGRSKVLLIVGASGAGKTTLVDLILGLRKPSNGFVKWRGKETFLLPPMQRIDFSYIPQSSYLVSGSLRDNALLGFSERPLSDKELSVHLKEFGLSEFLDSIYGDLDTKIGPEYRKLSGGEKQRLVIARSMINKPKFLIMDESSNALDRQTEKRVLFTVLKKMKNGVTIIISHTFSSLEVADYVLFLNQGRQRFFKKVEALTQSDLRLIYSRLKK